MDATKRRALAELLLGLVPADGTQIGNQKLRELFEETAKSNGHKRSDADFDSLRDALIEDGTLARGKGRGGSVRRANPAASSEPAGAKDSAAFSLEAQSISR